MLTFEIKKKKKLNKKITSLIGNFHTSTELVGKQAGYDPAFARRGLFRSKWSEGLVKFRWGVVVAGKSDKDWRLKNP